MRAAFTIVKDEPVMLPLWLDYYSRYFAPGDLYVLDHRSADGSTAAVSARCRVLPDHRDAAFDHRWLRGTVEAFQAGKFDDAVKLLQGAAKNNPAAPPAHLILSRWFLQYQKGREARLMLDEGVVAAPEDLDLAMITGAGFSFWNGGLTKLLDREGISARVSGRPFHPPRPR